VTKRLVFYTLSRATLDVFMKQVRSFYGPDLLSVAGYSLDSGRLPEDTEAEIVLVSSRALVPIIEALGMRHRTLVCRRTLDPSRLSPLFGLRTGEKVLVVNNAQDVAEETSALISRMIGDSAPQLVPWWPGCGHDLGKITTAVSPGFADLAPKAIRKVYDLGVRPIDTSTIVELALDLGLPLDTIHLANADGFQSMSRLVREHVESVSVLESAHRDLAVILDSVSDAVIMIDSRGAVRRLNNAARLMLGPSGDGDVSADLEGLIGKEVIARVRTSGVADVNRLVTWAGRRYLITVVPTGGQRSDLVITAREVKAVERARGDLARALKARARQARYTFRDIMGESSQITRVIDIASRIASSDTTVFISGETGTGKELFAQAIHNASPRRQGPFVAQNVAALSEQLVQSELFGYESGAFTDARREGKPGLFELAHGGTVFLDEIADISAVTQISLLRVLQEREIVRVGGVDLIPISVRIIAATNQDLAEAVRTNRFRRDLYYRLCAFPLRIPPLRERPEDIEPLAAFFIRKHSGWNPNLPRSIVNRACAWSWPGNVRELEEMIRYCASIVDTQEEFFQQLSDRMDAVVGMSRSGQIEEGSELAGQPADLGLLPGCIHILDCLAERASGTGIGREALADLLQERGIALTAGKIRQRLLVLNQLGLVDSRRGRAGTHITMEGERIRALLRRK